MSLNGLDDNSVTEAHITALGEAGGWFLLKYASRDSVQVLTRGTGGVAEARAAIAQYEEKSPLYGFLLYRRRKVLIKYMPDGTSRLLQARVAVHFTTITDKFTPHDAVVSITTPEELSDAALTSACSLHTAAPSSSSSSGSSRQNKLSWIREDAEESPTAGEDKGKEALAERRPTTASSSIPATIQESVHKPDANSDETVTPLQETPLLQATPTPAPAPVPAPAATVETAIVEPKPKPTIEISNAPSDYAMEERGQLGQKPAASAPAHQESFKNYDSLFEGGPDPRLSSQTARPTYNELYAEYYAMYSKPKVKLGPRPRPSLDSKRPHTSGSGSQSAEAAARPVSSLPPGLRAGNKKGSDKKRTTRDKTTVPTIAVPPPPPVPAAPEIPLSPMHPPKSPVSVKSMPIPSYSSHHRSSGVTPEKQRLMKALELRKRQMKAQKEKEAKKVAEPIVKANPEVDADAGSGDTTPTDATAAEKVEPANNREELPTLEEKEEPLAPEQHLERNSEIINEKEPEKEEATPAAEVAAPAPAQDELTVAHAETDDLTSTASACSPISAQTQGSSCAPSTRPSSISEDGHLASGTDQKTEPQTEAELVEDAPVETLVDTSRNADEEESIESSPTVVPESSTSIPSVEVTSQQDESLASSEPVSPPVAFEPAAVSDDALIRQKKRESAIYLPVGDLDDAQSRRRSKRESMIFIPSGESSQSETASQTKKKNRESMIMPAFNRHSFVENKEKRKTLHDPVSTLSAENSEAEYLSDDSFMEELQSAKVQEAKPILVSKSPTAAYFPRKPQVPDVPLPERSLSQQYNRSSSLSPDQMSRKSSGPWLPHANTDSAVVMAKKINVSSGISQRIKALAEKSNRDSTSSVSPIATPDSKGSIVAQRKSSFFATPPSGNSPNGKPVQRLSRASFANLSSNPTTPDRKSVSQPPPLPAESAVYNIKRGSEKPESVQVTARIIRDAEFRAPPLTMPDENTPLELHPSPITIDHQKASCTPKSPVKDLSSSRPPSSSQSQDLSAVALPRSSSESSWRSFGRRLSESKSVHSIESGDERKEKKDKKDSRTSKLFKRMSSISSIARKNSSAGMQVPDLHSTSLPSLREPPPPVQVGDLNIQFPDTLLWKRRWVEIDMMGNLVLSPSKSNEKGIVKRFHLTEFRTPYPPDQDRQELPNSVVLDFLDGRTLQCACETYAAQGQVLQILREAQDAWLAYSQRQ